LQGEWNLGPTTVYQFKTELSFGKGKQIIEIDSPSFLGGIGNTLGPMAYCVASTASYLFESFETDSSKDMTALSVIILTEC
jgi:hypothetical protein